MDQASNQDSGHQTFTYPSSPENVAAFAELASIIESLFSLFPLYMQDALRVQAAEKIAAGRPIDLSGAETLAALLSR